MTNFEKIKEMTIEELAIFINEIISCCAMGYICDECPLEECSSCNHISLQKWLKKEYE